MILCRRLPICRHYLGKRALSIHYESQGSSQCLNKLLPKF